MGYALFMLWSFFCVLLGVFISRGLKTSIASKPDSLDALIKKVKTEENKDQIEQLIEYHKGRVNAGADSKESYERLIRNLKSLEKKSND